MKKLIFISIVTLLCAYNSFGQEQTRLSSLSEQQEIAHYADRDSTLLEYDTLDLQFGNPYPKPQILNMIGENQNRLDSVVQYIFDSDYDSIKVHKKEYRFDASGNPILYIDFDWPPRLIGHDSGFKQEWEYDLSGNCTMTKTYTWFPGKYVQEWRKNGKSEYSFDSSGNLVKEINFCWDYGLNELIECGKKTQEYDQAGNLVQHFSYNWNPDLGDWVGKHKYEKVYDSLGNEILYYSYRWNSDINDWEWWQKREYVYDATGRICEISNYKWFPQHNIWWPYYIEDYGNYSPNRFDNGRTVYLYDNNNNRSSSTLFFRSGPKKNSWILFERHDQNYDSAGRKILDNTYRWNAQKKEWIFYRHWNVGWDEGIGGINEWEYNLDGKVVLYTTEFAKHEYRYDSNGNQILHISFRLYPEQQEWIQNRRRENSYDASGNKVLTLSYYWDSEQNQWKWEGKSEYSYDASGNQVQSVSLFLDFEQDEWILGGKIENSYDIAGNLILYIRYFWNSEQNHWIGDKKSEYCYNYAGTKILEKHYKWDIDQNGWIGNGSGREYIYDSENKIKIDIQYHWSKDQNDWVFSEKTFYYYHSLPASTGIKQVDYGNFKIYPNPTSGAINITGLIRPAEIKIYSIQGQLLKSEHQVENIFDISDLQAGVYYLNLTVGNITVVRKTVVKK